MNNLQVIELLCKNTDRSHGSNYTTDTLKLLIFYPI